MSLTRKDYEVFKRVFEEELGRDYLLVAPNCNIPPIRVFPRIMKKKSYYKEILNNKDGNTNHVYLDLFILENVPDNLLVRGIKGLVCEYLSLTGRCVYFWENRTQELKEFFFLAGKSNYYIRAIIGAISSIIPSAYWYNLADRAAQWQHDSKDCGISFGRKRYFGEIFKREQFLPGVEVDFEGEHVLVFSDYDPYLRNLYGEYMTIPPEEKREKHPIRDFNLSFIDNDETE